MILAPGASFRTRYLVLVLALGIAVGCLSIAQAAEAAGLAIDASVKTHQSSPAASITSGAISTTAPNDLLVAFITSDGPGQAGGESFSSVTGGGLTWKLRQAHEHTTRHCRDLGGSGAERAEQCHGHGNP